MGTKLNDLVVIALGTQTGVLGSNPCRGNFGNCANIVSFLEKLFFMHKQMKFTNQIVTCEHSNASVMSQSRNATTRGHTGIGTRSRARTGGGCVLWDSELAAWHMWLYHLLTIHSVLNICGAVALQFANNCMHQSTSGPFVDHRLLGPLPST